MDALNGRGKDAHPRNAVKKKPPSHELPSKGEVWNIEDEVDEPERQGGIGIMDCEGQTGESAAQKLPGDQNTVDADGAQAASQGNESEIPQHLRQSVDHVSADSRGLTFDLPSQACQTLGLSMTGLDFRGL